MIFLNSRYQQSVFGQKNNFMIKIKISTEFTGINIDFLKFQVPKKMYLISRYPYPFQVCFGISNSILFYCDMAHHVGEDCAKKTKLALSMCGWLHRSTQWALFSLLWVGTCAGLVWPCTIGTLVRDSGIGTLVNKYGKESDVFQARYLYSFACPDETRKNMFLLN